MLTAHAHTPQSLATARPFSLRLYLLLIVALSWPFQFAFALWAETELARFTLSSLSMVMVTVGTFIAGRYIFRDGFAQAGWRWGKPKHYVAVLGLALLVWAAPVAVELVFGLHVLPAGLTLAAVLARFGLYFVITLIPAFGEEFGWRGYMLRHLAQRHSLRRALLLHALIWWAWHLPALIGMGLADAGSGSAVVAVAFMLAISLIPAMMHAIIFAYIWSSSQSLAVVTVYHSAFDEVRDSLERSVGFGPLVNVWQMLVLTVLGAVLLWRGNWRNLQEAARK